MEQLGKMEQVAVYYQGPSGAPLLVADLGYHNPYLIKLYCKNERDEHRVFLAHMNSVQLLLAVEKVEIRSPKRTIGFVGQSSKRTSADHAPYHLGRYALFRNFIRHHNMLSWLPTSRRPL